MKFLIFTLRTLTVQLFFCQVFRILFIIFSPSKFNLSLIIGSLKTGFGFDLGVSLIVLLLLVIAQWTLNTLTPKVGEFIFHLFFSALIFIQSLAAIGDVILYKYWDCIFSIRVFSYLNDVPELLKNGSNYNLAFLSFYFCFIGLLYFSMKSFLGPIHLVKPNRHVRLVCLFFLITSSFLSLRGWFREIPRNQSDGFFCSEKTYNIASINSTWNFFNVLFENQKFLENNPYDKMTDKIMLERIREIQSLGGHQDLNMFSFSINPNIVLITMEGVSAEVLKLHNGDISYMPFLESLLDSSYYFSNAYSVGSRTEQGLGALLSGSLATPYNSITDNVSTLSEIPSILSSMKERKYHTHFVFGGNIEFANMRAYLTEVGFDSIIDIQNFDKEHQLQSLGVPDEFLFENLIEQFQTLKSPFFIHTLTLSTHEPFDIPGLKTYASERKMYLQSVAYLDGQLARFFNRIRSDKKFDNTLFIITSDHSHKMPNDFDIASKERYHIPFLLYSNGLNPKYRGYKDSLLFAQQNFPATLSYLLNWNQRNYLKFSRNHFSNMNRYTMSAFVNGYLYQTDKGSISYDYVWRPYDTTNMQLANQHSYPQAILQYLADQIRGLRPIREK